MRSPMMALLLLLPLTAAAQTPVPAPHTVAKYRLKLTENSELTNDAGFLLPFAEADSRRGTNALSLSAALSQVFSLKVSHTLSYLNEPVPGFGHTDTIVSAALVAEFAR